VLERWPGKLIDSYGLTEGGGTCMLDCTAHPDKLHTVGKPAPGHDIRLIDENGREVGPGQAGEVVGHSPGIMTGYHNQPAKTKDAEWYDPSGKRFIRTGDIGRFDNDGFLILMDRKKDMIISGGFNVYPRAIEEAIYEHPAVAEVIVIGIPDSYRGEAAKAFIQLKSARERFTLEELRAFLTDKLGRHELPAQLEFRDALPKTAVGKLSKKELIAEERQKRQAAAE